MKKYLLKALLSTGIYTILYPMQSPVELINLRYDHLNAQTSEELLNQLDTSYQNSPHIIALSISSPTPPPQNSALPSLREELKKHDYKLITNCSVGIAYKSFWYPFCTGLGNSSLFIENDHQRDKVIDNTVWLSFRNFSLIVYNIYFDKTIIERSPNYLEKLLPSSRDKKVALFCNFNEWPQEQIDLFEKIIEKKRYSDLLYFPKIIQYKH